jgi:peptidoglycan/LPS O-acetylase OafA/YrhL
VLAGFFHVDVLPGGYVGVDVFFVLSGFLITSLLIGEWDKRGGRPGRA